MMVSLLGCFSKGGPCGRQFFHLFGLFLHWQSAYSQFIHINARLLYCTHVLELYFSSSPFFCVRSLSLAECAFIQNCCLIIESCLPHIWWTTVVFACVMHWHLPTPHKHFGHYTSLSNSWQLFSRVMHAHFELCYLHVLYKKLVLTPPVEVYNIYWCFCSWKWHYRNIKWTCLCTVSKCCCIYILPEI